MTGDVHVEQVLRSTVDRLGDGSRVTVEAAVRAGRRRRRYRAVAGTGLAVAGAAVGAAVVLGTVSLLGVDRAAPASEVPQVRVTDPPTGLYESGRLDAIRAGIARVAAAQGWSDEDLVVAVDRPRGPDGQAVPGAVRGSVTLPEPGLFVETSALPETLVVRDGAAACADAVGRGWACEASSPSAGVVLALVRDSPGGTLFAVDVWHDGGRVSVSSNLGPTSRPAVTEAQMVAVASDPGLRW